MLLIYAFIGLCVAFGIMAISLFCAVMQCQRLPFWAAIENDDWFHTNHDDSLSSLPESAQKADINNTRYPS